MKAELEEELDKAWDEKQKSDKKDKKRQKELDTRRDSVVHNPETKSAQIAKSGTDFEKDLLYTFKQGINETERPKPRFVRSRSRNHSQPR